MKKCLKTIHFVFFSMVLFATTGLTKEELTVKQRRANINAFLKKVER